MIKYCISPGIEIAVRENLYQIYVAISLHFYLTLHNLTITQSQSSIHIPLAYNTVVLRPTKLIRVASVCQHMLNLFVKQLSIAKTFPCAITYMLDKDKVLIQTPLSTDLLHIILRIFFSLGYDINASAFFLLYTTSILFMLIVKNYAFSLSFSQFYCDGSFFCYLDIYILAFSV